MHLVFVSSLVPVESPASGFDIANRVVLDGLRMLGHKVTVVGYLQPGQVPALPDHTLLLGKLEVTNSRVGVATRLRWLAKAFLAHTTVSSAKMLAVSPGRIEDILKQLEPFDGLVLNSVQLPAAFESIFRRYPYLYVAHNVEFRSALENAETAAGRLEKMLFRREAHYLERIETELARNASWIWTFAEADRFGFGSAASQRACVLPLVTSTAAPEYAPAGAIEHDLGLIGTWSWKPNRAGLDWFFEKVVPHLPKDMSIAVAGDLPHPPRVDHAGVRFVGRVPDARAFVKASHAVPLVSRTGSGIQLKTIEALELGLPCVATRASLRGIDDPPENCVVEDEPQAFASACQRLVTGSRAGIFSRSEGLEFHEARMKQLLETMQDGLVRLAEATRSPGPSRMLAAEGRTKSGKKAAIRAVGISGGLS